MAATIAVFEAFQKRAIWTLGESNGSSQDIVNTFVAGQGGDMSRWDYFMLLSTGSTVEVFASWDGTIWSSAMALVDLGAASSTPVLASVSTHLMAFQGCFRYLKVTAGGTNTDFVMIASSLTE